MTTTTLVPRHSLRAWQVYALDGRYLETILRPRHWSAWMVRVELRDQGYLARLNLRTVCDWCDQTATHEMRDSQADDYAYACVEHACEHAGSYDYSRAIGNP